jgi:hypothetical protein
MFLTVIASAKHVGWAKPTGPREARPDDRLRVPTIRDHKLDGGHGAYAPSPTLRNVAFRYNETCRVH